MDIHYLFNQLQSELEAKARECTKLNLPVNSKNMSVFADDIDKMHHDYTEIEFGVSMIEKATH